MRTTRVWLIVAAAFAFASVVMGTVVCATESGAACPNWPGCYPDQFAPEVALNPMIEFVHRVIAGLTGPAVLIAAVVARKVPDPRPRRLAWIGLAGTLSAGIFGMLIVKVGIPWWLGMLDLASALVATVALTVAALLVAPGARWAPGRTAWLAWTAVGTLVVMHLLALAVAGDNAFTRCISWPLGVWETDHWPALQWVRIVLAGVAAVLIVLAVVAGVRLPRLRSAALASGAALVLEFMLGVVLLSGFDPLILVTAYAVTAAVIFGAVALLAGRASVELVPTPETVEEPAADATVR
ncbi:MAG TPA: hypothetical protein PKV13_06785 [Propionicimonas sp.]|nr:hypothetical protein [Propionicimonas sp.]HRA06311.1 hypothetical protein [Propionicimonas sp.]